jgi:hypothetical protein
MRVSPIISLIVGGLFINYYFGLFIILIYILKYFKKHKTSLILFLLYLLSIEFFVDVNSIHENWKIIFFIIFPHLIALDDILCHEYPLSEKIDFIMGGLFALSYLNANMYMVLILIYLLTIVYNKLDIRGHVAITVYVTLSWIILHIYNTYSNVSQDYLFQTIVVIGIGMSCFFGFLFSDEDVKSSPMDNL